ncbi:MAG: SpaA isopeptide-forming pilin-related protein [Faecalibacterium sp.]|nr:SpaA isopeptide-forming pilin-related protein [Faecalibacterium sp.]MDY5504000.1 SpaA isopeptide-forming pilin-related protein [Faecalibacterium sp.]
MEQKSLRRRFAALLLMLCLLAAGALPALATSVNIRLVDASGNPATGTIRVALYDSAKDKALSGGQLTLYRVAEVKRKNGDLSFEYCGDFYGCGIALGDLTDSTLADQLLEYMPQGARGTTKTVDADGNAAFENLELGLYLIVQSKASNGYAPIKPFLVSLPMAENGKWNYEVDASPKVGGYTPVNPDTPPVPPTPVPDKPGTPDSPVAPGNPDNPAAPGKPDNPALAGRPDGAVMNGLPQTGQLNWPVPVLAVSGMLLFAAGWVLNKKEVLP